MPISKENFIRWSTWNAAGFIPGPEEDEIALAKRAELCLNLRKQSIKLPFNPGEASHQELLEEAFSVTEELYGIRASWIPLFFSDYRLGPWHGGCIWIFRLNEHSPTAAFIQLRLKFKTSPVYLGIYRRRELLAHELAHAGRMMYEEPEFEEFFAYQSSSYRWRGLLGPIIRSQKESFLFIVVLAGIVIIDLLLVMQHRLILEEIALWLKIFLLVPVGIAFFRLAALHVVYRKCMNRFEALYSSKIARHLLYRLTDDEIRQFARSSPSQIASFIQKNGSRSFRWHFLSELYPVNRNQETK